MIHIDKNKTIISGELEEILSETAVCLNKVYHAMKGTLGEEKANSFMVEIGRVAIMKESEIVFENLNNADE